MARALHLPPGLPGSGQRRYAAAMWFHARGELGPKALEVYRVLAPRDGDDPVPLLQGVEIPGPPASTGVHSVETLKRELVNLLHRIRGRGVAETRGALSAADGTPVLAERANAAVRLWLPSAIEAVAGDEPVLAAALGEAAPHLPWQTYTDYAVDEVGPAFGTAHAFCTLLGEVDGCWAVQGIDVGLFLMAPSLLYRDHAHPASELYLPLTGPHGWRVQPDTPFVARGAFRPVWNDPEAPHATLTGPVPFLCLYAWLDHPQDPARIVPATDWGQYEP